MRVFDYIVQTFEEGNAVAVVTHIFTGKTPAQAKSFYRAHLKSDAFLRECKKGHFADFKCHNRIVGMRERQV